MFARISKIYFTGGGGANLHNIFVNENVGNDKTGNIIAKKLKEFTTTVSYVCAVTLFLENAAQIMKHRIT